MLYNRRDLHSDYEWNGSTILRTGYAVCDNCFDDLQEQLRSMALPLDPPDVRNPREEPYELDEHNMRATQADVTRITEAGVIRVTEGG